eukprot:1709521-Rhodomonas_salina.1
MSSRRCLPDVSSPLPDMSTPLPDESRPLRVPSRPRSDESASGECPLPPLDSPSRLLPLPRFEPPSA